MRKSKKHLSFSSMRVAMSEWCRGLPDARQKGKREYSIHDAMMSGFACMYFQDPTLLAYQERMKNARERSNMETLFAVKDIPKETQMRDIIDGVASVKMGELFKTYFSRLQRGKHLQQYEFLDGNYLLSVDGTQYHHSDRIHCSHCLTTTHRNGNVSYSHKVLQSALMHPDMKQVIPLMPEAIQNTDGTEKQDCEINAGKRLIPKIREAHPRLGIIILGDSLFSKQPFIQEVLDAGMHYVLVAKPGDHKTLYEWVDALDREDLGTCEITDSTGRVHKYDWFNGAPLNGEEKSVSTNFLRYQILVPDGQGKWKATYTNVWITDLEITRENVQLLVRGGRCRWKIENECFNTLKNHGYEIEHNYGHGEENLSYNFYLFTLLSFFFHQVLELTDELFQACRQHFGSKRRLWDNLRITIRMLLFPSWEQLLDLILDPDKYEITAVVPP